jgi:NAD(P)-dependent dehydrogenase (short-subunit alcohol dehydrogenase family)
MNRLAGKVAIITGAGSGVGRACMQLFAEEGACVVGVGRTRSSLEDSIASLSVGPERSLIITADLSKESASTEVLNATRQKFGKLDLVINAAGVGYSWQDQSPGSMNDLANTTAEKWREVMAINLDSCFYMCREAVNTFRKQGSGGAPPIPIPLPRPP